MCNADRRVLLFVYYLKKVKEKYVPEKFLPLGIFLKKSLLSLSAINYSNNGCYRWFLVKVLNYQYFFIFFGATEFVWVVIGAYIIHLY